LNDEGNIEQQDPQRDAKRSVLSGMFWKLGERTLAQFVSFVVSLVLARLLTPDDYGIVAMVLVFIAIADVFITSGFATALVQKKDADDTDFSTMFYCSLVTSLVIYAVIFFAAQPIADFYGNEFLIIVIRVFALRVPLSVYNAIQHAYVERHMLFKRFFWSTLIGTVVSGIVGIVMAYLGWGVWALIAQYFTNMVVDTIVLLITVPWRPKLLFSWDAARSLMGYGWKVLAADLSGTFFGQLRSLVIGKAYTSADLAFYNRGQQIPNLLSSNLGNALMSVLFPAMSNESDNFDRVKSYCRRALQVLAYVVSPLMLGMAAVATPLIDVLFSDRWLDSVPYFQVLCVGYMVGVLGVVPLQAIKAIGRSDVVLKLEFIKKPVFVILLFVGVYINVFAIAVTMVVYEFYGTAVNMWQLRKYIGYGFREQARDVLPAMALSGAMFALVFFLPLPFDNSLAILCVKTVIGAAVYIGASMALKMEAFVYTRDLVKGLLSKKGTSGEEAGDKPEDVPEDAPEDTTVDAE